MVGFRETGETGPKTNETDLELVHHTLALAVWNVVNAVRAIEGVGGHAYERQKTHTETKRDTESERVSLRNSGE